MIGTIYLAGPDVFDPNHHQIFAEREATCRRYGLKALVPADNTVVTAADIYRFNVRLLEACDAVLANLSPFRGPHCDVGTAWELGYAAARRTPLFAFSGNNETLLRRAGRRGRIARDESGMLVEDFGMPENLMIVSSIVASTIHGNFESAVKAAADYLDATRKHRND